MIKRTSYHVTYHKSDDNWHVQKSGGKRSSRNFDTQADAINTARDLAQSTGRGQIIIHRKDNNQIRTEYTYGDDPFPPAG